MNENNDNVILDCKNISKSLSNRLVLNEVSLQLHKNEFLSIIGPSGCGKTTLLRIMSGLITEFSGDIKKNTLSYAVVFQESSLLPWLTILDNIVICMNHKKYTLKDKRKRAIDYLASVELADFIEFYPSELSGGMIQKVNIVRAFASSADIIFMDEPFVHLDFLQRIELQKFTMHLLEKEKKTIFFITHNIHEAVFLSDRILVMSSLPSQILTEYKVSFARPRLIRNNANYDQLVGTIMQVLSQEVKKSRKDYNMWLHERHKAY